MGSWLLGRVLQSPRLSERSVQSQFAYVLNVCQVSRGSSTRKCGWLESSRKTIEWPKQVDRLNELIAWVSLMSEWVMANCQMSNSRIRVGVCVANAYVRHSFLKTDSFPLKVFRGYIEYLFLKIQWCDHVDNQALVVCDEPSLYSNAIMKTKLPRKFPSWEEDYHGGTKVDRVSQCFLSMLASLCLPKEELPYIGSKTW